MQSFSLPFGGLASRSNGTEQGSKEMWSFYNQQTPAILIVCAKSIFPHLGLTFSLSVMSFAKRTFFILIDQFPPFYTVVIQVTFPTSRSQRVNLGNPDFFLVFSNPGIFKRLFYNSHFGIQFSWNYYMDMV